MNNYDLKGVLLTRDCGDLWEGELEQDLLLVVHHIDPGPVHSNYHIVFRQVRTCSKVEIYKLLYASASYFSIDSMM
jgi:hypothetical protein